jgi:hypothetical protein
MAEPKVEVKVYDWTVGPFTLSAKVRNPRKPDEVIEIECGPEVAPQLLAVLREDVASAVAHAAEARRKELR